MNHQYEEQAQKPLHLKAGLEAEHETVGSLLKEIRKIINDFQPPEGTCGTYRLVYERLEMLEKDTVEPIHIENNILFRRLEVKSVHDRDLT